MSMSFSNDSNPNPINRPTVIIQGSDAVRFVAPCVVGLVILIGFVGNIFIILGLLSDKKRSRPNTPPCFLHWVIQNVSACDLALLFFVCPIFAAEFAGEDWIFGESLCSVVRPLDLTNMLVSFYSVCVVGIDTCFAVANPLGYQQKRNARTVGGCLIGVWVVAIALTLPVWVFARVQPTAFGGHICTVSWPEHFPISFPLYGLIFAIGLPLTTTACCIVGIFVNSSETLWRPTLADSVKKTKELVNLIIALAITGLILCAPYFIVPFYRDIYASQVSKTSAESFFTVTCFVYAYCCIKPMLYIFFYSDIRNLVTDLLPSRTANIKIRNGFKSNRSPRCDPTKPTQSQQHYVDHRYPESPVSTRSFPGPRYRTDSGISLQNLFALQFTEDGWRRKTL